ncbi:MAG: hypothetical protein QOE70_4380 [Chthoniobacter sp.]|jgi:hypothetical protein|nr:hypothetical protein [Chthoniobacter sp.]
MAAGDPILINLSGATFLLTAETGCIIQSADRTVDSKVKEVFNSALGYTIGYVFFDFVANQDFSAILNGVTGVALAQPGVALTLANDLGIGTPKNGVAAGGLYVKSNKVSHQGEDLRMISGSTIQRHGIA